MKNKPVIMLTKALNKEYPKRSKAKFKNFPQWVTQSCTKADLKDGFMIGAEFYRPVYGIAINGVYMPYRFDNKHASQMLHNHLLPQFLQRGAKFDTGILGFQVFTEGDLTNEQ
ncbi:MULTISPECIES: hypothetical protein [unclassified Moraxella]|uniref:hypothetical protein n=1 Tax=unclassified Moraxella TaxID=2685852 RepID=UPI003AF79807